jgi:hypothetical protein
VEVMTVRNATEMVVAPIRYRTKFVMSGPMVHSSHPTRPPGHVEEIESRLLPIKVKRIDTTNLHDRQKVNIEEFVILKNDTSKTGRKMIVAEPYSP